MSTDSVIEARAKLTGLQQEGADLPMLIQRAAEAGNTVMVRQLKQRQTVLQDDIGAAQEAVLLSEIAQIEARIAERTRPEAEAKARVEELQRKRDELNKALAEAEASYNGLWIGAIALGQQRGALQAQLRELRREQVASILAPATREYTHG